MLLLCCWLTDGVREVAVQQLVGGTKKTGNATTTYCMVWVSGLETNGQMQGAGYSR